MRVSKIALAAGAFALLPMSAHAKFLSADPVGFTEGGVDYFNRYSYVANNPVNATDPDGRDIHFIFVQDPNSHGLKFDHSATFVDGNGGDRDGILFDPGGSFEQDTGFGSTFRNGNTFFENPGQDLLNDFIGFESQGDKSVNVITLFTDENTDAAFASNIENFEGAQGPGDCASACSRVGMGVLSNSGKNKGFLHRPSQLRNRTIKDAKITGGLERTFSGNTDSQGNQLADNNRLFHPEEQ